MPAKTRTPRTGGARIKKAKPAPELPTPGMDAFHTRTKANEGHKIPLYSADGQLTAHWLRVRGVDSDAFRKAQTRQTRRVAEIAALTPEAREDAIMDATLEMQAALVAEWSFDMECTHDNVKTFLRDAPQIAAEVDKFASRRTFFFKTPLNALMPSQPPSSP
jgi:hypothetical protein